MLLFDRSGPDWSSRSGIPITSRTELQQTLRRLSEGAPRIFDLVSVDGTTLQFGTGGDFAFAQFFEPAVNGEGNRSAWVARAHAARTDTEVEFVTAGTPTPIAPEYCLSIEELTRIAEFFLTSQQRNPAVPWEKLY